MPPGNRDQRLHAALSHYFKTKVIQTCLIDTAECSERIIRAHSIQNSFVLDQIAVRNHVYMIQLVGPSNIGFKLIGRNQATTFTGLCSFHDNKIFSEIDFSMTKRFDPANRRLPVLFYTRAIAHEYWKKLNTLKLIGMVNDLFQKGEYAVLARELNLEFQELRDSEDALKSFADLFLQGTQIARNRLEEMFKSCLYQLSNEKYHLTTTVHRTLGSPARMAVSAAVTPYYDFDDVVMNDLTKIECAEPVISVFPEFDRTHILMSIHRKMTAQAARLLNRLERMHESEVKIAVSKFLILLSENVVFSPDMVDGWDAAFRDRLLKDFERSITLNPLPSSVANYSIFGT